MESNFKVDNGAFSTMQGGCGTSPAVDPSGPSQAWQFVNDFEQLIGDSFEPDPLFFEESWTLGASAAAENLRQRRLRQSDRRGRTARFSDFDILGAQFFFVHQSEPQDEQLSSTRNSNRPPEPLKGFAAQSQPDAPQEPVAIAEEFDWSQETFLPMTQDRACRLLGVTAASTRMQVKSAYRRLVTRWHPDLLECQTENLRQIATVKMAAINEAYHLLYSGSTRLVAAEAMS